MKAYRPNLAKIRLHLIFGYYVDFPNIALLFHMYYLLMIGKINSNIDNQLSKIYFSALFENYLPPCYIIFLGNVLRLYHRSIDLKKGKMVARGQKMLIRIDMTLVSSPEY